MVSYPARADDESFEDYAKKHNLPPPPKSFVFLANLPIVAIADIPAGDLNCSICLNSFVTGENGEGILEVPTRLPCGHIIGNLCLRRWVFPYANGERCPICRADCLLEDIGYNPQCLRYETNDAREISFDEEVWANHEGGIYLSKGRRAWIRESRYIMLERKIIAARDELDRDLEILDAPRRGLGEMNDEKDGTCARWRDTRARWKQRKQAIDDLAREVVTALEASEADAETGRVERERERLGVLT